MDFEKALKKISLFAFASLEKERQLWMRSNPGTEDFKESRNRLVARYGMLMLAAELPSKEKSDARLSLLILGVAPQDVDRFAPL